MIEMIRRQQAAQAAVDRFKGQPWQLGKNDCVRMAAFVLRKMGHRPQLGKAGSYTTAAGAMLALKRVGHDSLAGALDSLGLERIAPAAARVADIVMIPGEAPLDGALTIAVGNGRVLGFHEDVSSAEILQPVQFIAAWRV
ncbi:DUF6950 family protein [Sphingomonas melonis]|uniref:DUF6950 domain-containing protein n=1 Tax=Sphingomonas melonis TaxID=152682 RepID=A0A7Y9FKQ5_9SPHN|nr:hypothetical protein [Sphingomonas melonis]NYD88918.1 hypothetical protein [Sphingomonas melonis]